MKCICLMRHANNIEMGYVPYIFQVIVQIRTNQTSTEIPVEGEFEDTKETIRIRKSKNRQHNGHKKKGKQRSTKH